MFVLAPLCLSNPADAGLSRESGERLDPAAWTFVWPMASYVPLIANGGVRLLVLPGCRVFYMNTARNLRVGRRRWRDNAIQILCSGESPRGSGINRVVVLV